MVTMTNQEAIAWIAVALFLLIFAWLSSLHSPPRHSEQAPIQRPAPVLVSTGAVIATPVPLERSDSLPQRLGFIAAPAPLYSSFFANQQEARTSGVIARSNASRSASGLRFVKPAQRYSLNNQRGKTFIGFFKCQRCNRRWKSHLVTLKSTDILSRSYYRQDCATCETTTSPYAIVPAVCEWCGYEQCVCSKDERKKRVDQQKPHRGDLCEVCKNGLSHYSHY